MSSTTQILMLAVYKSLGTEKDPIRLAAVHDLSIFNWFIRGTYLEHLNFATRAVVQRTGVGTRQTIKLKDDIPFIVHAYVRADGLSGIMVTQKDYSTRVAYTLINKIMSDYDEQYYSQWKSISTDQTTEPEFMKKDLALFQNPNEADKLIKIQKNLDEIKEVMVKNIADLLDRDETLAGLVAKSQDLSDQSKVFATRSEKLNCKC